MIIVLLNLRSLKYIVLLIGVYCPTFVMKILQETRRFSELLFVLFEVK
jgi:hypothetical protein